MVHERAEGESNGRSNRFYFWQVRGDVRILAMSRMISWLRHDRMTTRRLIASLRAMERCRRVRASPGPASACRIRRDRVLTACETDIWSPLRAEQLVHWLRKLNQ